MKPGVINPAVVSLVLLLAPLPSGAQNAGAATSVESPTVPGTIQLQIQNLANAYCPAGLDVQQSVGGELSATRAHPYAARRGRHYHLTTTDGRIVSMEITVHGIGAHGAGERLLQDASASDVSKTLTVALDRSDGEYPAGDIALEKFATVTSLDIDEVIYRDGTAWHSTQNEKCVVEPDRVMLISAR